MRLLRVLRGILKTAVTWSVVWVPLSVIPYGIMMLATRGFLPRELVGVAISAAVTGAINGGVFSTVLAIAGRRKTFESLSLPWIAACGAIGAVVFPVVVRSVLLSTIGVDLPITAFVGMLATNAALGAGFAAASLAVARRAPALRDGSDSDTPSVDSDSAERQLGVGEHSAIASAPRRLA